ncbi:hypothetical protein LA080_002181 [Diaporthe eres]|nr:hypothetical protein LA080_002181 [Diaporthe eres]
MVIEISSSFSYWFACNLDIVQNQKAARRWWLETLTGRQKETKPIYPAHSTVLQKNWNIGIVPQPPLLSSTS